MPAPCRQVEHEAHDLGNALWCPGSGAREHHGMMVERDPARAHLGGYLQGGDPDTYYPAMWDWLIDTWEVKSVIDIGCGDGKGALNYFIGRGVRALGIDGMPALHPRKVTHDFAESVFIPKDEFDLAWSAEFVEHVEERHMPNFMPCFGSARFACITHGDPGQPGHHHVNNQTDDYWKGVFAAWGFEFDAGLTAMTRAAASVNTRTFNHYRRSGLAFRRRS